MTVISTLQQLTVAVGASTTKGHALSVGEERKRAAHAEACHSVGVSFIPLVIESLGGWSDQAADTIRCFGRLLGQRLGTDIADTATHLFQRLSIRLWLPSRLCSPLLLQTARIGMLEKDPSQEGPPRFDLPY